MLESIITLIGSPLIGGIVGAVGSYFTKKEETRQMEIRLNHEHLMETTRSKNRQDEIMVQGQADSDKLEGEAFVESQRQGNQNSGNEIMDGIKTLARPLITLYLLILSTIIGFDLYNLVNGLQALPSTEIVSLYKEVIFAVLSLTSLCCSWWFGSRTKMYNIKDLQK